MTRRLPATLSWRQPKASQRTYELASEDQVLDVLSFPKLLGTLAETQAGGTRYTFKRSGFLNPKVTIRKAPFEQDIGTMAVSWRGDGAVSMDNGRRYALRRPSVWAFHWQISDEGDGVMADIRSIPGLLRFEGKVDITERGSGNADILLLLALAWYMMVLIRQEGAAGAAGA